MVRKTNPTAGARQNAHANRWGNDLLTRNRAGPIPIKYRSKKLAKRKNGRDAIIEAVIGCLCAFHYLGSIRSTGYCISIRGVRQRWYIENRVASLATGCSGRLPTHHLKQFATVLYYRSRSLDPPSTPTVQTHLNDFSSGVQ